MTQTTKTLRSTAIAAVLGLPLATGAAWAQSQGDSSSNGQTVQDNSTAQMSSDNTGGTASTDGQAQGSGQSDALVATVGETEIRTSDVMDVVTMLPPQMQSQPPQMLIPMALEQLVLRELILADARSQNLADDPDVVALVDDSADTARDDAMVRVWLDRRMSDVVTDETVQQAYDEAAAQSQSRGEEDLPPLAQVRPQIEQYLRQQAMQDIRTELRDGAEIVLYDPSGNPVEPSPQNSSNGSSTSGTDSDDAENTDSDDSSGTGGSDDETDTN